MSASEGWVRCGVEMMIMLLVEAGILQVQNRGTSDVFSIFRNRLSCLFGTS
jgi:hypothetical protein